MVKEVANLHTKIGLSWKKIQSFGLAYYWIPLYLKKKILKEDLIEKVIQAEKNYAKRQMTWFSSRGGSALGGKRDKRIEWLENYQQIKKEAKKFLK
jgi:tRNA A37 N6-isopentenylltransferase MiaA